VLLSLEMGTWECRRLRLAGRQHRLLLWPEQEKSPGSWGTARLQGGFPGTWEALVLPLSNWDAGDAPDSILQACIVPIQTGAGANDWVTSGIAE